MSSTTDYTIIIPVYYNEGSLRPTFEELKERVFAHHPDLRGNVIFVDDGSGDGSMRELLQLREENPELVTVIKLTRNFGQVNAIMAGYTHATGRCVVTMSADSQDSPGLINDMLAAHFGEGYEIVICSRAGRDESWFRIITSRVFYALMRRLSFPTMPSGGFDYALLGRRALDVLLRNREAHPFFQGQILWTGFTPKFLEYHRRKRICGKSRWTYGKKLTYLIDGILSYSYLPLRLMSLLGILIALISFLYTIVIFVYRLMSDNFVFGWAPLMIAILFVGGLQMVMLGIIGEYLWRTLAQARSRDEYVIDRIYGGEPAQSRPAPSGRHE